MNKEFVGNRIIDMYHGLGLYVVFKLWLCESACKRDQAWTIMKLLNHHCIQYKCSFVSIIWAIIPSLHIFFKPTLTSHLIILRYIIWQSENYKPTKTSSFWRKRRWNIKDGLCVTLDSNHEFFDYGGWLLIIHRKFSEIWRAFGFFYFFMRININYCQGG
jgi:hypothetical protein